MTADAETPVNGGRHVTNRAPSPQAERDADIEEVAALLIVVVAALTAVVGIRRRAASAQ